MTSSSTPFQNRASPRLILLSLAILLAGSYILIDEVPTWRAGGSDALLHNPLAAVGTFPIRMQKGASVYCMGDSNTRGRFSHVAGESFPDVLRQSFGSDLKVFNLGRGGAVVPRARVEEASGALAGDLVVLAFGTNDAAPRGWLSRKKRVPIESYQALLEALANRYREEGAIILILAPMPAGTIAIERRIAPYRNAARQAAINTQSWFLDPVEALTSAQHELPPLQRDGLHLNATGSLEVGRWLAGKLDVA